MSNTIYSIQEKLNSILDIEQTEYEYSDAELFDTSDYPNDGIIRGFWKDKKRPPFTDEHRRNLSLARKGKPISEEVRLARIGKKKSPHTEETKKKMRESAIRRGISPETRAKLDAAAHARKGIKIGPYSKERCQKISESLKGNKNALGVKRTAETKEKIRQARIGKKKSPHKEATKIKQRISALIHRAKSPF